MNKFSRTKFSLVAAAQILAITLLSACTTVGAATLDTTVNTTPSLTACHATGDPANPYVEITVANDISPVPANGCPTGPVSISAGKITICHATGSETNPYTRITVSVNGLEGHGSHEGDIFPASDGSCPTSSGVINNGGATPSTVCHATNDPANPYEEITVNNTELNEHQGQHPNDIIPAPVNGCPASPVVISDGQITICHATSSDTNPYNEITVSVNGLNGHGKHEGDIIPVPDGGCPTSPPETTGDGTTNDDGKITICHATSSDTNPYNEITVSVNGLNGHDKHDGDIIPAPEGGCPTNSGDDKPGNSGNNGNNGNDKPKKK